MDRRWIIATVIFLLLVGLVLFLRANLPVLVQASPTELDRYVTAKQPLVLRFSAPMQPESLREKLEIQPVMPGNFTWEADTFTFTPSLSWPSGEVITITLRAGAQSELGLPILGSQSWFFSVSPPLLTYLWPSEGPADLYAIDFREGLPERLMETANGILAYDISTDGTHIYYSTRLDNQGSAIFRLNRIEGHTNQILTCIEVLCSFPQISPGGEYLTYTRTPANPEMEPFPQQVWLLPIIDGEPVLENQSTLVSDPTHPTGMPFWSPTGLLTFHDRAAQHFVVLDPQTDQQIFFPNETGEPGTWAPDGSRFVAHEIEFWGDGPMDFTSHLWRFNYPTMVNRDLSLDLAVEDVTPVYALTGRQIAFGRKYLDAERWIPGSQLWLMNADGSRLRQITDDPDFNHANFAWHPNEPLLAFVRHEQTTLTEPPEIWIINADGSNPIRLIIGGYEPQWIP